MISHSEGTEREGVVLVGGMGKIEGGMEVSLKKAHCMSKIPWLIRSRVACSVATAVLTYQV